MNVDIREVQSRSQLKEFVRFPYKLYKGNKYWVPDFFKDELDLLDPKINPAFEYSEVRLWLAYKDKQVAGRIGAIIIPKEEELTGTKYGRITRLEFIDDRDVSAALLETAEDWLRENGITTVHGPLGFSNLDHQGILIEGFEYLPSIVSSYHMPYYLEHLEAVGYEKENDWLEFRLTVKEIPEKAYRLNEMIKKRYNLKVKQFTDRKEVQKYPHAFFKLLDKAFERLPYVLPYNEKMVDFYSKKFFSLLLPKYIRMIFNENEELIGFIITIPSMSRAFQKAGGKMWPFGFYHILRALKKNDTADLVLTGVDPQYQRMGVAAILITEIQQTMLENGIKYAETTGIFESNQLAIQTWKNYDHIQHKRKRCFVKQLT
jgi:GNAT superfamily N-acetyltransferase